MDVKKVEVKTADEISNIITKIEKNLSPEIWKIVTKQLKLTNTKTEELGVMLGALTKEIESLKERANQVPVKKGLDTAYQTDIVGVLRDIVNNGSSFPQAKLKYLNETDPAQGWALVFDQFEKDVLDVVEEETLLKNITVYELLKGNNYKIAKWKDGIIPSFVTEGSAGAYTQGSLEEITIDIVKSLALIGMSEELLGDSMSTPNIYQLVVRNIGRAQSAYIVEQVLNWNGVGQNFTGILNAVGTKEVVLEAGKTSIRNFLGDSDLTDIITANAMEFKRNTANVSWIISQYVYGVLRNIRTTTWMFLYPELRDVVPTLMGNNVIISSKAPMQTAANDVADTPFLIYGDLEHYALIKRSGLEIEMGHSGEDFTKDLITLKAKQRLGWEALYPEAFVIAKTAAA